MAPEAWIARLSRACLFTLVTMVAVAPPTHALRIVNWNILNYPGSSSATRNPNFRTVLSPLAADVVVVQEMQSQVGVDGFLGNVLNTLEPGQWAAAPFTNGNDTDNAFFYRSARVSFLGQRAFYVSVDGTRLVNEYQFRPVGYTSSAAEVRIYSVHLKASNTSGDAAQRLREATGLRDTMNNTPPGTHLMVMGDFNVYSGTEGGFSKFLENQADNDGRAYDPQNAPSSNWNSVDSLKAIYTQSTSLGSHPFGGASGGLDDRFDMILPTYNFRDGEGFDLVAGSYVPVGNDGLHYNNSITDAPTLPEGSAYASALLNTSDHLPVRVDVMIPARVTVSGGPFAFGTVITGATATTSLTVGNPALPPADTLEYALSATSSFTAPAGSFTRLAGPGSNNHTIGMDTSVPGAKSGTATVHSNSLDAPNFNVGLSGTVIRHASPSLDSAVVVAAGTLDFGVHDPGGFTDDEVRVHNQGYSGLQAQLGIASAAIAGGVGRFTITDGTVPIQLGGVGTTYSIHFDDAGATRDSLYEAVLVIQSADQALPGATQLPDLQVTLTAKLTPGSTTGIGDGETLPTTTRLHPPFPNPLGGTSTVHFDLARGADVRLEVFDLSGRRVATLASHAFAPGRWSATWNGRQENGGPAGAGLYFVRMSSTGLPIQTVRLAVVR